MNELDDLKKIWQEGNQSSIHLQKKELEKIISKKSAGMLDWLKLIAKIEDWANFSVTIVFTVVFALLSMWEWAIIFGVIMLTVSFYYHHLYKIIHRISYSENVLEFLEDTYAALKSFLKKYLIGLIIISTLSYGISFSMSYSHNSHKELDTTGWVILIIVGLLGLIFSIGLVYLYYYLIYGRKAVKLKKMIRSLKEN